MIKNIFESESIAANERRGVRGEGQVRVEGQKYKITIRGCKTKTPKYYVRISKAGGGRASLPSEAKPTVKPIYTPIYLPRLG